jgi:hypothetical protein
VRTKGPSPVTSEFPAAVNVLPSPASVTFRLTAAEARATRRAEPATGFPSTPYVVAVRSPRLLPIV